jgi:hypothetical protein
MRSEPNYLEIKINPIQAYLLLVAKLRYVTPTSRQIDSPDFYADLEFIKYFMKPENRSRLRMLPSITQRLRGGREPDFGPWRDIVDQKVDELLMNYGPLEVNNSGETAADIVSRASSEEIRKAAFPVPNVNHYYTFMPEVADIFSHDLVHDIRDQVDRLSRFGNHASIRWLNGQLPT